MLAFRGRTCFHIEGLELMAKRKEITIRSGAAGYLSYVASVGDQPISVELRYEDENI